MGAELIGILAPAFALAATGYAWARAGEPFETAFVTRLLMLIAAPSLVFVTLAGLDLASFAIGRLTLAALAAYGALAVLFALGLRLAGLPLRVYLAPLVFGNTGNLGLPIALFAFGAEGLAVAVVIFALTTVLMVICSILTASGELGPGAVLRQPMVYAALLGVGAAALEAPLPRWLEQTLGLAGQLVIPMMLLTLGVAVSRLKATALPRMLLLAVVKLGLGVGVGLSVAAAFALEGAARGVFVLQVAAPVAVISYLFAERYDAGAKEVAALVLVSTGLCALTLPWLLASLL